MQNASQGKRAASPVATSVAPTGFRVRLWEGRQPRPEESRLASLPQGGGDVRCRRGASPDQKGHRDSSLITLLHYPA